MKLVEQYQGGNDPFEGDRTLWLRGLPEGAQVTRAMMTIVPAKSSIKTGFKETVTFKVDEVQGYLKDTQTPVASIVRDSNFVEVDFRTRRTLAGLTGSGLADKTLQIDMGGLYMDLNDRGSIKAPDENRFFDLVDGAQPLPGLTLTKFKVGLSAPPAQGVTPPKPDISEVAIRIVPSNLNVRLGQLPAFWTQVGDLPASATSPDFAAILNAFLVGTTATDGFYAIPFVIHTDTIARLDVTLHIDYVITQRVLPPYLPEATLSYGFSTLPDGHENLLTARLPQGAIPLKGQTDAQIQGEFKPTRIALGPVGNVAEPVSVLVAPGLSLAQPILSEQEIAVTAIDLPLTKTQANLAGLSITIQSDADGKPSGEVLASAQVIVGKPLPPDNSSWGSATLSAPFRLLGQVRHWLILQSQVGEAFWQAQFIPQPDDPKAESNPLGLQSSRADALTWRAATAKGSSLDAIFRLRNLPEQFTVPVQLQLGKEPNVVRRRLDEFAPLGRIEFQFDFSETLTEYLTTVVPQVSCGRDDRLINGDFRDPAPDDATAKLVDLVDVTPRQGYYEQRRFNLRFQPVVDLSSDRFLVLKVGDRRPIRIDCAGRNPARTEWLEMIDAINTAAGAEIAFQPSDSPDWVLSGQKLEGAPTIRLYFWCSSIVPTAWQATPGYVRRLMRQDTPQQVFTLLVDPEMLRKDGIDLQAFPIAPPGPISTPDTLSLSQRVTCRAGCTYLLQFVSGVLRSLTATIAPPSWQVVWFDQSGNPLRTDEERLEWQDQSDNNEAQSRLYEARLTAPVDTAEAEIRFVQPTPGGLWLESVRFVPRVEVLNNSTFALHEAGESLHWQRVTGSVQLSNDRSQAQPGVVLGGFTADDTVLTQVTDAIAGGRYQLQVRAGLTAPPAADPQTLPTQQRSRLELRWLGNGVTAMPVILPLDGFDFPTHAWAGVAPTGAQQVEIRLVQPKGQATLRVESVSLSRTDGLDVPLLFLSEAPGELTISNLRVAYDTAEPLQPLQLPPGATAPLTPAPPPTPPPAPPPPPPTPPPSNPEPPANPRIAIRPFNIPLMRVLSREPHPQPQELPPASVAAQPTIAPTVEATSLPELTAAVSAAPPAPQPVTPASNVAELMANTGAEIASSAESPNREPGATAERAAQPTPESPLRSTPAAGETELPAASATAPHTPLSSFLTFIRENL